MRRSSANFIYVIGMRAQAFLFLLLVRPRNGPKVYLPSIDMGHFPPVFSSPTILFCPNLSASVWYGYGFFRIPLVSTSMENMCLCFWIGPRPLAHAGPRSSHSTNIVA